MCLEDRSDRLRQDISQQEVITAQFSIQSSDLSADDAANNRTWPDCNELCDLAGLDFHWPCTNQEQEDAV